MQHATTRKANILCLNCNTDGTVFWRLDQSGNRRQLERLSAGFVCVDRGGQNDPHCQCARCREPATETGLRPLPISLSHTAA